MKPDETVQLALDAAAAYKTVQQALKQKHDAGGASPSDGITHNPDGTVTIRRSFRLDPRLVAANSRSAGGSAASGAARENGPVTANPSANPSAAAAPTAQDAAIPCCDGKGHDTPVENCKAKNPMFCPYHGVKAMEQNFLAYLQQYGLATPNGAVPYAITKKPSGAFQVAVTCQHPFVDAAVKAINDFLKQAGFKAVDDVGAGTDADGKFGLAQAFKQDKSQAPDDLAMLQEWHESLLEDAATIGSEKHLELLSMLAELDGADPSQMTDAQKQLLENAKAAYHQLKAESDFQDVATDEDAYAAAAALNEAADALQKKAKSAYIDVKAAKKDAGFWKKSPSGFPGNPEYNAAYEALFGQVKKDGANAYAPGTYDASRLEQANDALIDALAKGDMDKAKKALYDLAYAKDQLEKHLAAFGQHAEAMKAGFAKFKETGLDPDVIAHNSAKKNKAIFAAHGLKYPEELQKDMSETVAEKKSDKDAKITSLVNDVVQKATKAKAKEKAKKDGITAVVSASDEILPPLAHDESKFPANVTQQTLDDALAKGTTFGNSGSGLAPAKVSIGGKTYVLKKADDGSAGGKAIRNGYAADMAYRAGGIHAPDSKLYQFGGSLYKLSEFVEGTRLDAIMKGGDEKAKEAARQALLKGYPLDVLFSNWDVLGTNGASDKHFTNVIIDKHGNAYRIDNDGAFDATGAVGGKKNLAFAKKAYCKKDKDGNAAPATCSFEQWDENGGWAKRAWIDDFRTMRLDPMNHGVFDGYTTADIFLAAGNVNMAAACQTLPASLQEALRKPLFEMNQMATHAVSAAISGIRDKTMLTQALDTMYEASKLGFRQMCNKNISWGEGGFGETAKSGSVYKEKAFGKPKPEPPENPMKAKDGDAFSNEEYTGYSVGTAILNAAKTINHHAGFVQKDAKGNVLGNGTAMKNPDYTPNAATMAAFGKVSREKLAKLAESDEGAKHLLDVYDAIVASKKNGYKVPIGHVRGTEIAAALPKGFKTQAELAFEKDEAGAMAKYQKDFAAYEKALDSWKSEKALHDQSEHDKAVKSGKNPYVNFNDFAEKLLVQGVDTNGVRHPGADGIDIIENGKYCNKYGGNYEHANTHNDSWTPPSSKLKVLEHVFRGMTLDQIAGIKDSDPLINNGHHSDEYAVAWFKGAVKEYQADPALFARDCRTYACWKGLQTLKLENESCDVIRHDTHSVGLNRAESYGGKKGSVTPVTQKAANTSCGFQDNGCINHTVFAYDVPFWNVAYTYNDANRPGSKYEAYKGTEHEWVATLIGLTPYCPNGGNYAAVQAAALATEDFKAAAKKRRDRLAPFMTTIDDIA